MFELTMNFKHELIGIWQKKSRKLQINWNFELTVPDLYIDVILQCEDILLKSRHIWIWQMWSICLCIMSRNRKTWLRKKDKTEKYFNASLIVTNLFVTYYKIMTLTGKRQKWVWQKDKEKLGARWDFWFVRIREIKIFYFNNTKLLDVSHSMI